MPAYLDPGDRLILMNRKIIASKVHTQHTLKIMYILGVFHIRRRQPPVDQSLQKRVILDQSLPMPIQTDRALAIKPEHPISLTQRNRSTSCQSLITASPDELRRFGKDNPKAY